ncbi:MAG TPA: multicopper oxidase domain-containing protein, partial [Leptolyngbyaceae cyanobacterium]
MNSPRVSIHLHGSNTEPQSDGYPTDTFTPGQTYVYNFNNNQEAATLWYHDHALGITSQNVM